MQTFKRFIFFYFVNVIALFLIELNFGPEILNHLKNPVVWIFPLVPACVGQFFGFLTYRSVRESWWPKIFAISFIFSGIIFNSFIYSEMYSASQYEKHNGNIHSNNLFFEYMVPENYSQVKQSFDTLIKKYNSPNDIEIVSYSINKTSVSFEGGEDTLYKIRFLYNKNSIELKAFVNVFKEKVQILYYDEPLTRSDKIIIDLKKRKDEYEWRETLRRLPDSIRKELEEELK